MGKKIMAQWHNMATVVILLIHWPISTDAINLNPRAVGEVTRAYGFLVGQMLCLEYISDTYPDLRRPATMAQREFDLTFPGCEKKIAALYPGDILKNVDAKIEKSIDFSGISRSEADKFIALVERRAKGEVEESVVLKYLLATAYESSPIKEFQMGFKQAFSTRGRPKAQGVMINLELPLSWAEMPGDRPHIVRKWVNENGNGMSVILLQVRDEGGHSPTRREIRDLVGSREIRRIVSEVGTYSDAGAFTIEQLPGYWYEFTAHSQRVESTIYQKSRYYQFYYNGKGVLLCFGLAAKGEDISAIEAHFPLLRELSRAVVNTLVLPEKY